MNNHRLITVGTMTHDLQALKVCMSADDQLWYLPSDGLPQIFGGTLDEFTNSRIFRDAYGVRLLGLPRNAELLQKLYKTGARVQLASPATAITATQRSDPAAVLRAMRNLDNGFPPSLGGWRNLTQADLTSYHILTECRAGRYDNATELLRTMRVYRVWQFCTHLSDYALAQIVGEILDPRWFVALSHPDSVSKLRSYMGLAPRIAALADKPTNAPAVCRYRMLRACWKENKPEDLKAPGAFLWQQYLSCDKELRELRTSQRLLSFLRYTWLEDIYHTRVGCSEPLFVPGYFFKTPEHAAAFCAHQKMVAE